MDVVCGPILRECQPQAHQDEAISSRSPLLADFLQKHLAQGVAFPYRGKKDEKNLQDFFMHEHPINISNLAKARIAMRIIMTIFVYFTSSKWCLNIALKSFQHFSCLIFNQVHALL